MSDKTMITVEAHNPDSPGGRRVRAGFKFGPNPMTVEVTPEQMKEIEGDPLLKIIPTPEAEAPVNKAPAVEAKEPGGGGTDKHFTKEASAEDAIKTINATETIEALKLISIKGNECSTVKSAYAAK